MSRSVRIVTGLVLFFFIASHLVNLSLGLVSLELLERARPIFMAPWSNPVGMALLMLSMLAHMIAGLQALYRRNTLQMPVYDSVQLVTALAIFPLLIPHVAGIIAIKQVIGTDPSYRFLLGIFWIGTPLEGLRQVLVLVVAWIHGAIGMFTWLKLKSFWPKIALIAYAFAVAIPVLSLLGFVEAGNRVIADHAASIEYDAAIRAAVDESRMASVQQGLAFIDQLKWTLILAYFFVLLLVLLARMLRLRAASADMVRVRYLKGPTVTAAVGPTLLEISRLNDLPHANICRGRGRCGTCRVRIISSSSPLAAPSDVEQKTLDRLKSPPDTRLACQIGPGPGELTLERLVPPDVEFKRRAPRAPGTIKSPAAVPGGSAA